MTKSRGRITLSQLGKILLAAMLGLIMLNGCTANGKDGASEAAPQEEPAKAAEPVTLQVFAEVPITDPDWDTLIAAPLKKKFPQMTLELAKKDGSKGSDINSRITGGYTPDLLLTGFNFMGNLETLQIPYSIDDLVKQSGMDLSGFDPVGLQALRGYDGNGRLIGLPLYMNVSALTYNKDLFDKFGVAYPTDGMSWDDVTELTRKVTRTDGGVNYMGIWPMSWSDMGSQLSIQTIDPKTNKALVNNDQYRRVFQQLKTIFSIPGMDYGALKKTTPAKAFFKDNTLAMYVFWFNGALTNLKTEYDAGHTLNWDLVTQPHFPEKPGVGAKIDAHVLIVSSQSRHKQEAFEAIRYLTSSDEVQTLMARAGKIPARQVPEVSSHFGENVPFMQGKHVQAIFAVKMAPLPKFHVLENTAVGQPMNTAIEDVLLRNVDINTALRKAEEQVNQNIKDMMTP